jgi:phosphoglycerate dehydrogenase-like enzyme
VLIISFPLTDATPGFIGCREPARTKLDAMLVNVAREPIVDKDALYEHLQATPSFSAGLDAWWRARGRLGSVETRRPLFELPNLLLGSPHISANTTGSPAVAARHAAKSVAQLPRGEPGRRLVNRADYVGSHWFGTMAG